MGSCQRSRSVVRAHGVLSELTECCQSSRSVVRAHRVVSELTECCQSSRSVVRAHGGLSYHRTSGLSELTECGQSSCSVHALCMHLSSAKITLDALAAAGSSLKAKHGHVSLQEDQQIINSNMS